MNDLIIPISIQVRVQLRRTKGWKMPENTLKVDRSTKWGNPFKVLRRDHDWEVFHHTSGHFGGPPIGYAQTKAGAIELAVKRHRQLVLGPVGGLLRAQIVRDLRGKHLACWCPLGSPCHADTLLEVANAPCEL